MPATRAAQDETQRRARFEELAAVVYEPLQRYVHRRTDPSAVDDVVADAMLVLWRRLDDVPLGAELPWAYGVARRCLANEWRSQERRRHLVERLEQAWPAPSDATGSDALNTALWALSDADRDLLTLWAWEQLEPREIALALGISANAAAIRLYRAKRRLKAMLDGRKDPVPAGHEQGGLGKGER